MKIRIKLLTTNFYEEKQKPLEWSLRCFTETIIIFGEAVSNVTKSRQKFFTEDI